MVKIDINSLYQEALSGDRSHEDSLFEALSVRFRFFARQRIWDELDAEEAAQEALMTVFREYKKITISASFSSWAYKVLDNKILTYVQKRRRETERRGNLMESHSNQTGISDDPEFKRRLLTCLQKIASSNLRYARILNLHYQGFTTDDICARMDISAGNLYTTLSRARSLLEFCLDRGDVS